MILQEQCECWSCPCCKVLYCCRETILVLEEYWEFATWLLFITPLCGCLGTGGSVFQIFEECEGYLF
ncbi:hypothetical protein CISIN_1g038545mg [Citrus sinensis]|uniref:Uncharacterized protein n=1 Tax=Citrus sinensis TaxID=2711 RepID=A0A067H9U6_CITSI|nr:hypothetical protein CISIN_1g038545mg [Citrus sinensis]